MPPSSHLKQDQLLRLASALDADVRRIGATKRKRNGLEIIAEMLEASRQGSKKTNIMYSAKLSYELLVGYLAVLMESGLIETNGDRRFFITSKGARYLKEFREMRDLQSSYVTKARALSRLISDGSRTRAPPAAEKEHQ